ncbi:UNVERIFIED_CONTAM: hypothetical protein K2H54_000944 [Gekko kuhli]
MEPVELQATLHLLACLLVPCMILLCCLNSLLLLHRQNPPGSGGSSSSPQHHPGRWWSRVVGWGRGRQWLQWQAVLQTIPDPSPASVARGQGSGRFQRYFQQPGEAGHVGAHQFAQLLVGYLGHLPECDPAHPELWETLVEQLKDFVLFQDIEGEEKKKALLLSSCGIATLRLVQGLITPTTLIKAPTNHFAPQPTKMFMMGIREEKLHRKLIGREKLTLAKALCETAESQSCATLRNPVLQQACLQSWVNSRRSPGILRGNFASQHILNIVKVEKQGLDKNFNLDSVDGVPTASTEQWSEASDAERLRENLKAYWAFQILLDEILEEQRSFLTPNDLDFHASIQSVLLQVSALAYQLEELMVILEHNVPAKEWEGTQDVRERGFFEKKLRGLKVLQELAQWSVRSVRDLHQLSKPAQAGDGPHASCC